MQEAIEQLEKASTLLCQVEVERPIDEYTLSILAKIFQAHASIKLANARLLLLIAREEETGEEAQNDSGRGSLGG